MFREMTIGRLKKIVALLEANYGLTDDAVVKVAGWPPDGIGGPLHNPSYRFTVESPGSAEKPNTFVLSPLWD